MRSSTTPSGAAVSHLVSSLYSRIKDSASSEKWYQVISHYKELRRTGIPFSDPSLFPCLLQACQNVSFIHGKSIHACMIKQGFDSSANSILDFYKKGGELDSALGVFASLSDISRDSVTWNIMINSILEQGSSKEGLHWFADALVAGNFEPNISTLVLMLRACRNRAAVDEGMQIHGYILKSGFGYVQSVQNSLLSLYATVKLRSAQVLFDEMLERDVISWSALIGGYAQSEEPEIALRLFQKMVNIGMIEPDGMTLVSVLRACSKAGNVSVGMLVHGFVIRNGFGNNDIFVWNSLIDMYARCNNSVSAYYIFCEMPSRNLVSWNSMLTGFIRNERVSEALSLIDSMVKAGLEPDGVTLTNLLQICKSLVDPFYCKMIHCKVIRGGYESSGLVVANLLIDAYARCNLLVLAWELFIRMKQKDVVSWSTMIAGFTHCGKPDEAISLFSLMIQMGNRPNSVAVLNVLEACSFLAELRTSKCMHGIAIRMGLAAEVAVGTSILTMYSESGATELSRRVFDQIVERTIVSWSAMIRAYGMNGCVHDALSLLVEMKIDGLKPNSVVMLSLLSACSHSGFVQEGLSLFKEMVQDYGVEPTLEHYSCMVDMLSRAGMLNIAMALIKKIPENLKASPSAWGALLSACRNHGDTELGAEAASQVLKLEPSDSAGYVLASGMFAADGLWDDAVRMRRLAKEREVKVVAGYSLVHANEKA
ncbi:Pentatricopeptide repeat [Dillenia turbinata]|uniref:Pentatricopeptide repeat n=1 Tax=Dillenia turbinata TaxID=194707 RepID=A0AAN8UPW3_9MAGN